MILLFPDLNTVRLALTSGLVPADVTLAPAAVSFNDQGWVYVEPSVNLSKAATRSLDRIGVKGSKRHGSAEPLPVANWLQILPATKEPGTPQLSAQTPVLFELTATDDLPTLVSEMLRLGNDRQSFRTFSASDDPADRRVLLRVIGPPYYTLLRALDQSASGTKGEVRAYLERAPRVWVEIGCTHPLAAQIHAAEEQLILIRPPRDWLFLDEAPYQDVYDIVRFDLPAAPVEWEEAASVEKLTVPLRLTAGNAADVPELWVLRNDAVNQLDAFVRDAEERLVQRLMFAIATDPAGRHVAVLRTRPSKLLPPILPLDNAQGFKPVWKLPNLYLPVGKRLHPTLRRDVVRRLLADDPDQVVWLNPEGPTGFTPESVPDAAFRPLENWVDYVIETERDPLAAWIEATRFDFDSFICSETDAPKPKPDSGREPQDKDTNSKRSKPDTPPAKLAPRGKLSRTTTPEAYTPVTPERQPSEWEKRRAELEEAFQAIEGPLDTPEQQALWPELATANAGMKDNAEAAVCWLNALWWTDPAPTEWLVVWMRSEFPTAGGQLRADDLDRRMKNKTASLEDHRAVVAGFLWAAAQEPVPAWLRTRLPAIQKYLEANEGALPVRAVWLAAFRLAQLVGADVLGLARVRDRLLQRLLNEGLNAERDLPFFLRTAGLRDSERLRAVRAQALDLHQTVRKWNEPFPMNLPYVDLMFGFVLAKLGESAAANQLMENARRVLEKPIPTAWPDHKAFDATVGAVTGNFLFQGFRYRIEQALAGKPLIGPLPPNLLEEREAIVKKGSTAQPKNPDGPTDHPYKRAEYVISRMQKESRLLDPEESREPYAMYLGAYGDPLRKELTFLSSLRDPALFAERVRRLYRAGFPGKTPAEVRFYLLHEAVPLSPRVGESFSVELLNAVPGVLKAGPGSNGQTPEAEIVKKQGELLERSLFVAAHFGRADLARKLVDQFTELLRTQPPATQSRLINIVAGQYLRSLKKLGLRDEIDRFLNGLQATVLKGANLAELRSRYAGQDENWAVLLRTLLNLAAGWLAFGLNDRAFPILEEAGVALVGPNRLRLPPTTFVSLASTYLGTLGHAPWETGLPRIVEFFAQVDPKTLPNTWTGGTCYSRLHLQIVEDVVHTLVSDDFALGTAGRRWLDDDEYLVRQRIHADLRRNLERSGL